MAKTSSKVLEYRLPNGLAVFIVKDPSASLLAVRTYVRAGSIYEAPYLGSGLSHYLEHLVAGGSTEHHPESYYKSMISYLGGAYNAYTTVDHTCYYINTVPRFANEALSILYDWMFFNAFKESEFNRERDVIIKEIEKNNASVPRTFYQLAQDNTFNFHPIRYPVIGYLENFKKVTLPALKQYYSTWYVPSNMALVIGGNVDEHQVMEHVRRTFGSVPTVAPPSITVGREPLPFMPRTVEQEGDTSVTYLSVRFPTVDIFSGDLYALDLLDFVLGNGEDSILNRRLVEEKKLAFSVYCSSYTPGMVNGYFEVSMEILEKNKKACLQALMAILDEVKAGKLDRKQIERAQRQKLADDVLSVSTIEDQVERVGQGFVYANSKDFYTHYAQQFKSIKKEDVVGVAKRYLNPEKMIVTVLSPKKPVQVQEGVSSASAVIVKKPKRIVLKNGVRLLLYPDSTLPRVTIKVFALAGLRAETPSTNGIGYLTADLLGRRSKAYSKQHIFDWVEGRGAHLSGTSGPNTLSFTLTCVSSELAALVPIWADAFIHPVFDLDDIAESKRKIIQRIAQRPDDWFGFGLYHFRKTFFKTHPYGLSGLGEPKSVKALSKDDLVRYHSAALDPKQLVVVVAGEFDQAAIAQTLEATFSNLQPVSQSFIPAQLPRVAYTHASEKQVTVNQDIAALFMGYDGVRVQDQEDGLLLDLLDCVLTGATYPSGRLHNGLRDNGLVYMVHGAQTPGLEPGYLLLYALTSEDKLARVRQLIEEQIADLKKNLISEEEFKQAIAQLEFYHKDRAASLDSFAVITATDELYGNGYDYYVREEAAVQQLTREDVQRAALKFLQNPQVLILKGGK